MKNLSNQRHVIIALLLATMATASFASLATAEHGRGRRYRGHGHETRVVRHIYRPAYACSPRGSYTVWRSHSGSTFAGFVGGLFVGAAIANAAPVSYTYWDTDCDRSFVSLEVYHRHSRYYDHRHSVRVIEVPDGRHWDDYHACGGCGDSFWGDDHECD